MSAANEKVRWIDVLSSRRKRACGILFGSWKTSSISQLWVSRPIVMKLHQEVVALLQQPAIRERLLAEGAEPVGNTPDQFRTFIDAEIAKWGKIIRGAGLTAS